MRLEDYFQFILNTIYYLNTVITSLGLTIGGELINLRMLIGFALAAAIVRALLNRHGDEYDDIGLNVEDDDW